MGIRIGYARVSTNGQSLELQREALTKSGCEELFEEKLSGKQAGNRPQLQAAMKFIRKGDILVVTKLDRLARSMTDLWALITKLEEKSAHLEVLQQPEINTTKREGKLIVSLLGYVAETERQLILERTAEGRARAKAAGKHMGRRPSLSDKQLSGLKKDAAKWEGSMAELGKKYGISRASVYRLLAT